MRLPGESAWLGMREVRIVNGQTLPESQQLLSLLRSTEQADEQRAAAVVSASAKHNLGPARTINVPTLPLELLHARHRDRLMFVLEGRESVRGVRVSRIAFVERGSPTMIRGAQGRENIVRGTAWVGENTGGLMRAHVFYRDFVDGMKGHAPEAELRVEFAHSRMMSMLVPQEMREKFAVPYGRGEGRAVYSNYRKFATSARILP